MVLFHMKQIQVLNFGVHEINGRYKWCGKEIQLCSCVGDSTGGSHLLAAALVKMHAGLSESVVLIKISQSSIHAADNRYNLSCQLSLHQKNIFLSNSNNNKNHP